MDFSGRYEIPAPPEEVWRAINDPEVLKICIPGCESVARTDDNHFEATARLKIGPVSASFKGKVALEERDPPRRCVLRGEGQGGVAGFAKGEAEVLLEPSDIGTVLTYTAKANVGGKLAQIGQRLVVGAAKQIADDFFAKFAAALAPGAGDAERPAIDADAAAEAEGDRSGLTVEPVADEPLVPPHNVLGGTAGASGAADGGAAPDVWIVGLVAVIVILLILFSQVL